ncbi:MAG: cell division protein FtsB [Legionellales bacterium]|jgi:cell division protein FtsB
MKNSILIITCLSIFLIIGQIDLWVGQGGLMQFLQLKNEVQQQKAENTLLEVRNSVLHAEVLDLKSGHEAIEERARVELGMIKPGEIFYQLMGDAHEAHQ